MPSNDPTPSDAAPDVLAIGGTDVTTLVVSLSERHPEGRDAEYLAWHALDHRPEQHRLTDLRGSLRFVSTPACRTARAAAADPYDRVDHVMTYLFADPADLDAFRALGSALAGAGRMPLRLPSVELGVWTLAGTAAAPAALAGADVIPWRPCRGAYLLIEAGEAPAADLTEVEGVAGVWWTTRRSDGDGPPAGDDASTRRSLAICFLDDEPAAVAERLDPVMRAHWADHDLVGLLAAPFVTVEPWAWDRHLPFVDP